MLLLYPGELYRLLGASSLIYTFTISGYGYTTTLWPILYYCPCFYFIPLPFQEIGIPQHFGLFYTFTISGDGYTTTLWSILYYGSMFFLILYFYHFRRWVYHNTLVYFILWVHVFFNSIPLPLQEMGIPQHFCLFYAISPCFYYIPLSFQEMGIPHHFGLFYAMGPCFF